MNDGQPEGPAPTETANQGAGDLRTLVAALSTSSRAALEAAAQLAYKRTNYELSLEHWLISLLDDRQSDFVFIAEEFFPNRAAVRDAITMRLDRFRGGSREAPAIHSDLVTLLEKALLVSLNDQCRIIRSCHLLTALVHYPQFHHWREDARTLLPFAQLRSAPPGRFAQIATDSAEGLEGRSGRASLSGHIFVSYSRKDFPFAFAFAATLRELNRRVWMDAVNLSAGEDWDRALDRAIEGCAGFIVLLTPESVESVEVRAEIKTAIHLRKLIIPVLVRPCRIPRYLTLYNYADYTSTSPADLESGHRLLQQFLFSPPEESESSA